MSTRNTPWPAGTPCWTDLATPDVPAARDFYGSVLGWSFETTAQEFADYVTATVEGKAAAAMGPLQGDQQRPSWTVYLASDDADKTAAAITEAGGTVLLAPGDVGTLGRMLIGSDPAGGVFGVWQAGTHIGASVVNEPGGMVWEDLRSTDPDAARAFYQKVFGLEFRPLPGAGDDYMTAHLAGSEAPIGGMGGMAGAPEGTPSHWLVYFGVADVDAAVAAATSLGGQVLAPAFDTPFGRMGALVDPAGAAFWVTQAAPD